MKHLFLTSSVGTPGVGESILSVLHGHKFNKTAYITTAIECEPDQIGEEWDDSDHGAISAISNQVFDYTVSNKTEQQIRADLKDIDCLYVAGGNSFYLLQESQKCNFKNVVHELVNHGVTYIGCSAGSVIAGPDISPVLGLDSITKAPHLNGYEGYHLVDFVVLPHWGSDDFHEAYLSSKSFEATYKTDFQLISLNNYEYVEVVGDKYRIIDIRREK